MNDELFSLMARPLATYSSMVVEAMHLLREQITDRGLSSSGILRWFENIEVCIADFDNYDEEDLTLFWQDVATEIDMQHSNFEYCLEAFEEIGSA